MSDYGYRKISPRDLQAGDRVEMDGKLEQIHGLAFYPPNSGRPELCPIRPDWWAVQVMTESGERWMSQPAFPGRS